MIECGEKQKRAFIIIIIIITPRTHECFGIKARKKLNREWNKGHISKWLRFSFLFAVLLLTKLIIITTTAMNQSHSQFTTNSQRLIVYSLHLNRQILLQKHLEGIPTVYRDPLFRMSVKRKCDGKNWKLKWKAPIRNEFAMKIGNPIN